MSEKHVNFDEEEFENWLNLPITKAIAELLIDRSENALDSKGALVPYGYDPNVFFEESLKAQVRADVWKDIASFFTDPEVYKEEFEEDSNAR